MAQDKAKGKQATANATQTRRRKVKVSKSKGIKTSKNLCNLCNRRTQSNMVLCSSCQQWQHRGCAKISLSDYTSNWRCVFCNN
ncbi:uncharacterized protein LOC125556759 isoform X3 [Nematostella vectensis]|uniref:uncharacterized protein LOC125556759 isoform X3 n=1 Tax=Nematostella vectensis TaxID=45351 RepID=UPI0020772263|nr:uncharacterized protein LOC125556759 isoform X3 [Nematostella vectensis]